ncbi:MAG: ABC transporter ATP-binding protein [Clostridiales bacterium]|nr:ABC transporter ATP-binding protein [Clostridiales bacterium]
MIELEHVTKLYGSIPALRDVSLHVPKGQTVGLLGRNGAGKTTALNLMTGYFPPTEGKVRIAGKDMLADPRACKRMIGYLPEKPPLYDEMTVEDYLAFVCELREVVRKANKAHVEEIMELCALKEMRQRLIGHLSKGYRQRVGIAQALCGSPEILILDEPTVGLDPKQTVEMRELIRRLGEDHTVLFSSHILSEVQQLCSRVIILNEGRMVQSIDLAEEKKDVLKLRLRAAAKREALLNALKGLKCVMSAEAVKSPEEGTAEVVMECRPADESGRATDQIFRLLAEMNAPIRMLNEERDTLEEIFLRETQ